MSRKGFTLVELMIAVVIIGILVAIAVPNYIGLEDRAKEAGVKVNMHVLRLALEDFAAQTIGAYPDHGASTTPAGETVEELCPSSVYPTNPFTGDPTAVTWDADPASSGVVGVNPASARGYVIKGFGRSAMLLLELRSGRGSGAGWEDPDPEELG